MIGQIHVKRSVKIAISGLCLSLIGLTAAIMIAANGNGLIVLIPFALATLVSLGAIWWAQRCTDTRPCLCPRAQAKIALNNLVRLATRGRDMHQERQLSTPCEETLAILMAIMPIHGIHLERSFDLRSALHHQPDCPCPQHGTTSCTCQYVVLLAYDPATAAPPAVITAHECDGITRVRVTASEPGGSLSWPLLAALDAALATATVDV